MFFFINAETMGLKVANGIRKGTEKLTDYFYKEHGIASNFPKPSNLTTEDLVKRMDYNAKVLAREVLVSNKKLEETIGTKLTANKPIIQNDLTKEELIWCIKKNRELINAAIMFGKLYLKEFNLVSDQYFADLKSNIMAGKTSEANKELFTITKLRQIFKEAKKTTRENQEEVILPSDTKTLMEILSNEIGFSRIILIQTFLDMYKLLGYFQINYTGATVPLYDVF